MADYAKVKSTRAASATSADIKAIGGPAYIHKIVVFNTGTAGTAGSLEFRDAQNPAGDTGTLRFDFRFGSADEDTLSANRSIDFPEPLYMPDGIRVVFNTVTNVVVWVFWEG